MHVLIYSMLVLIACKSEKVWLTLTLVHVHCTVSTRPNLE